MPPKLSRLTLLPVMVLPLFTVDFILKFYRKVLTAKKFPVYRKFTLKFEDHKIAELVLFIINLLFPVFIKNSKDIRENCNEQIIFCFYLICIEVRKDEPQMVKNLSYKMGVMWYKNRKVSFWVIGGTFWVRRIGIGNKKYDRVKNNVCRENMPSFTVRFTMQSSNLFRPTKHVDFILEYTIIKKKSNIHPKMPHYNTFNNNNNNSKPYRRYQNKRPHPDDDDDDDNLNKKPKFTPSTSKNNKNNNSTNKNHNQHNPNRRANNNSNNNNNNTQDKKPSSGPKSSYKSLIVLATNDQPWLKDVDLERVKSKLGMGMTFVTDQIDINDADNSLLSKSKGRKKKLRSNWNCLTLIISMSDFMKLALKKTEIIIPGTCNKVDTTFDELADKATTFKQQIEEIYGIDELIINIIVEQYSQEQDQKMKLQIRNLYGVLANLEDYNIINLNKIFYKFYDNSDNELRKLSCDNTAIFMFLSIITKKSVNCIENVFRRRCKSINGSESIWDDVSDESFTEDKSDRMQLKLFKAFMNSVKNDNKDPNEMNDETK